MLWMPFADLALDSTLAYSICSLFSHVLGFLVLLNRQVYVYIAFFVLQWVLPLSSSRVTLWIFLHCVVRSLKLWSTGMFFVQLESAMPGWIWLHQALFWAWPPWLWYPHDTYRCLLRTWSSWFHTLGRCLRCLAMRAGSKAISRFPLQAWVW